MLKICYFGNYDPNYSRNRILIDGLKKNGVAVIECNDLSPGWKKFWRLFLKHRRLNEDYQLMLVGFPGQSVMPLAKLISKKPVVFDAFLSFYEMVVADRRLYSPFHPRAWYYWLLDWLSCHLADQVLLDTSAHIDYFVKTFGLSSKKIKRIFVGADDKVFSPRSPAAETGLIKVHFHGSYIPLQGVEYIIKAAKLLEKEPIIFNLIGRGQTYDEIISLARSLSIKNVNFIPTVSLEELAQFIAQSQICLGIFGNTPKTQRVIPNKVYQCLAMKKPVISADTPAIRELFNEQEIFLVPTADAEALAAAIRRLIKDRELREQLAFNGFEKFIKSVTPEILGRSLLADISPFL